MGYLIVAAIIFFAWLFWPREKSDGTKDTGPDVSSWGCGTWLEILLIIGFIAFCLKMCHDDSHNGDNDPSEWVRHG